MNPRTIFFAIASALAGFLFGFDTAVISEIFPNRQRAEGQALGSFPHWIFAALLTTFFPRMVTAFEPGYVFAFFCGMMVLQLVWVTLIVPETKGIALEDMQRKLGIE